MQTKDACAEEQSYARALSLEVEELRYKIQLIHSYERSTDELACQADWCNDAVFGQYTENEEICVQLTDEGTQTPHRKEYESTQTVRPTNENKATQTSYYDQFELLPPTMEHSVRPRAADALRLETRTARGREVYWCEGLELPKYYLHNARK